MLLRETIRAALAAQRLPDVPPPEVERELAAALPLRPARATVLTGVRRAGKSTLQTQLARRSEEGVFYCNFEDTRLFGLGADDFPTLLALVDQLAPAPRPVFLDEVQEVAGWQRLVRTLVDRRRAVCVTGSNASLVGRELGTKLTGRQVSAGMRPVTGILFPFAAYRRRAQRAREGAARGVGVPASDRAGVRGGAPVWFEVFPFSYREYCAYTGGKPGARSLRRYLDDGGFPLFLQERRELDLQHLLRDVVQRDVAARHGLRDVRHVMNLLLFLLANPGQPFSFQRLTKALGIPTVSQTSRYLAFLQDAYLLFAVPRFSASFRQRVVAPAKYYAIDNGLRRANSPQFRPDLGRQLENVVAVHLRRTAAGPSARLTAGAEPLCYAGERDRWECDFVTHGEAIQVCYELTPENRTRELRGLIEAARLPGGRRRALVVTFDQADRLREAGVEIRVVPAWRWMG